MRDEVLRTLYQSPQTLFTFKEISLLFPDVPLQSLRLRMSHIARTGSLIKLRKGVYAKENFDPLELANKLYAPSYISVETVLQKANIVFQYDSRITAISYLSRTIHVAQHTIIYRKIKDDILLNTQGITQQGNVMIASPERAFTDAVFLYRNYFFDNLRPLNWDIVMQLREIYHNKAQNKRIDEQYRIYKEDNVGPE